MEDPVLGSWPPVELSELRLACEECHKRKIRCRVSHHGSEGTCEACSENQRQCLFSLKSKTGRPRKASSQNNTRHGVNRNRRAMSPSFLDRTSSGDSVAKQSTAQRRSSTSNQIADYFSSALSLPTSPPLSYLTPHRHTSNTEKDLTVFQNFHSQDEDMTTDRLVSSLPLPSPLDTGPLPDSAGQSAMTNCFYHMSDVSGEAATTSTEFFDVMQICNEIHGWSQNCSLDLCADTSRNKIFAMSCTIDKLFQTVLKMPQDQGSFQARKEQYSWTILRVAVEEAVEIIADLVSFTLKISEQQSVSTSSAPIMQADQWSSPDASSQIAHRQLEIMMVLCRLDHSLFHFGSYIAAQSHRQGSSTSCASSCRNSSTSQSCRCSRTALLSRTDQVRRQAWGLMEKLRDKWV